MTSGSGDDLWFHSEQHSRHWSNNTVSHVPPCSHVLQFAYQDRCSFIRNTTECHHAAHYVDYLEFVFCTFGVHDTNLFVAGLFFVFVVCLYLFTVLATTADKFFCPALAAISKMLKMSESLAGVTLLAFGNGSPDIFASLSHSMGDTEIIYTELLGAAIFVTGFIAGCIILIKPFKVVGRNYVRDVVFFMVAIFVIDYCIHDQGYTLIEGILTIIIYMAYLFDVITDHIQDRRELAQLQRKLSTDSSSIDRDSIESISHLAEELEEDTAFKIHNRRDSSVILDEDIRRIFDAHSDRSPNEKLFKTFLASVNPIDSVDWAEARWLGKTVLVLKAPVLFVLSLIIPIFDYGEPRNGWSKLLNVLNVVTLPQLFLFVTGLAKVVFFNYVPLSLIVVVISLGVSVSVFFTSRNDSPPKYHVTFAAGSVLGSICVIFMTAKEVVSVMKTIGIITDRSDSMVGLMFLAIGNSIGDLFSNISLAKQGYQQMAFAACFGGPLLNSLLGVGLTFIIKALNSETQEAFTREGALGPNCVIFLLMILFFPCIGMAFFRFYAHRGVGYYMLLIYGMFLLYAWLGESEIMHPYGADHQKT